jgi:hypothetical protein
MRRFLRSGIAVFALLLSLLIIPAAAGAAPGGGNSQYAQACQKGGYENFTRTDGSTFANTGDCASYAAGGGTLVPVVRLPDLLPTVACVTDPTLWSGVRCTFTIVNVGTVATTGPVRLQVALAPPAGTTLLAAYIDFHSTCDTPNFVYTFETEGDHAGLTGDATCDGTIAPGDAASFTVVLAAGTGIPGVPLTITATADPGNTIAESNEGNNTHGAVIPTP